MIDYIGVRCPVCEKKFTGSDDIVVCPTCGAPHHRACYFEKGHCVFEDEHISGKEWRPPYEAQERVAEPKTCLGCNKKSPADNLFCNYCGRKLDSAEHSNAENKENIFGAMPWLGVDQSFFIYGGLDENEIISDEITAKDMAMYVGSSSAYYLPRFKAMAQTGRTISVNFSAMIFGFAFYFYRKMYLLGSILLVLFLLGTIPNILITREILPSLVESMDARSSLEAIGIFVGSVEDINQKAVEHYENISRYVRMINFVIVAFTAFLANHVYYEKAKRDIKQICTACNENESDKDNDYESALLRTGGCSRLMVAVAVLGANLLMAVVVINFVFTGG